MYFYNRGDKFKLPTSCVPDYQKMKEDSNMTTKLDGEKQFPSS